MMNSPNHQPAEMKTLPERVRPPKRKRGGFTLIELLVAIVIISILLAILLPAISSARTRARNAKVRAEISQLETSLGAFKAEFGFYPPSSITLCMNNDSTNPDRWDNHPKSKAVIMRMFPQFDFSDNGGGPWSSTAGLNGGECLVFFLGGVTDAASGQAMIGFSKNPARPFLQAGNNRIGPYFEFDPTRLMDFDGDQMPEYRDSLISQTMPIAYLSANDGAGYDIGDIAGSGMTDVYRVSAGGAAYKPKSFQIISPGADQQYGLGGVYNPENTGSLSEADRDNITNFVSNQSVLAP